MITFVRRGSLCKSEPRRRVIPYVGSAIVKLIISKIAPLATVPPLPWTRSSKITLISWEKRTKMLRGSSKYGNFLWRRASVSGLRWDAISMGRVWAKLLLLAKRLICRENRWFLSCTSTYIAVELNKETEEQTINTVAMFYNAVDITHIQHDMILAS